MAAFISPGGWLSEAVCEVSYFGGHWGDFGGLMPQAQGGMVRPVWDDCYKPVWKCGGEVLQMEDLVEVGQYDSVIAADLVKASLESFGIQAILINKGIAQIYPGATYAFGGIKLMVRAEDAQVATQLLSLKDEPN